MALWNTCLRVRKRERDIKPFKAGGDDGVKWRVLCQAGKGHKKSKAMITDLNLYFSVPPLAGRSGGGGGLIGSFAGRYVGHLLGWLVSCLGCVRCLCCFPVCWTLGHVGMAFMFMADHLPRLWCGGCSLGLIKSSHVVVKHFSLLFIFIFSSLFHRHKYQLPQKTTTTLQTTKHQKREINICIKSAHKITEIDSC